MCTEMIEPLKESSPGKILLQGFLAQAKKEACIKEVIKDFEVKAKDQVELEALKKAKIGKFVMYLEVFILFSSSWHSISSTN